VSESVNQLPTGWRWATLGDCAAEVRNGISTRPDEHGDVPIFRISAVRPMELRADDIRFLPGPRDQWSHYVVVPGDLLFTRYNGTRSLVGVCAVVPDSTPYRVYPDKLIRVRIDPRQAVPKYIEKAVHVGASRAAIDQSLKTSAGQVGISGAQLKEVPIPLAPLSLQSLIVEKIEALTAKSRRAKEALDAIAPLLERFRQSVLAAAFRGDLTKDWREQNPDVEPADQLLARIRRERRARWEQAELDRLRAKDKVPKGDEWKKKYVEPEPVDAAGLPELPTGWCWTSLDAVTDPARANRLRYSATGPRYARRRPSHSGAGYRQRRNRHRRAASLGIGRSRTVSADPVERRRCSALHHSGLAGCSRTARSCRREHRTRDREVGAR
jgi:type I restriction enzyme, S subunit